MTFPRDTCPHTIDAGAWVLHALPDEEAQRFATHLASGCPACRAEVDELQMVVDVLPCAVPQHAPPPALKGRIMSVVRAEAELLRAAGPEADRPAVPAQGSSRSRRGWRGWLSRPAVIGALACAMLALGAAGGVLVDGSGSGAGDPRVIAAWAEGPATARLVVDDDGQGALELDGVGQAPDDGVYQVWLKRPGQDPVPSRTVFDVRPGGETTVRIAEPVDDLEAVLVTAEPSPGSPAPTSAPIITSYLS